MPAWPGTALNTALLEGSEADIPPPAAPCEGRVSAFEIVIDHSQAPDLEAWAVSRLRPELEKWYPMMIAALPSEGFVPPDKVHVAIAEGEGIAYTAGTRITVMAAWIRSQMSNPKSEAVGSVIHELAHVVQQYGAVQGGSPAPGWLVEGIADHIRWWRFEPPENRRPVSPSHPDGTPASYKDGYQTTAAFLEYLSENYDASLVAELNAAGRAHAYSPLLWEKHTGRKLDALWGEFAATLGR